MTYINTANADPVFPAALRGVNTTRGWSGETGTTRSRRGFLTCDINKGELSPRAKKSRHSVMILKYIENYHTGKIFI